MSKNVFHSYIKHEGYYRYMDSIHSIHKAQDMCDEDIIELTNIRSKLINGVNGNGIIDHEYTKQIMHTMLDISGVAGGRIMDYGCGYGLLAFVLDEHKFNPTEIICIDLSDDVLDIAKIYYEARYQYPTITSLGNKIEYVYLSNKLDLVIASFVMHFRTDEQELNYMYASLNKGGVFVFNYYIYEKQKEHFNLLINTLRQIGYEITILDMKFKSKLSGAIKTQKIVKCVK